MTRDQLLADLARALKPEALSRAEKLLAGGGDVDAFLAAHGAAIDGAFPDRGATLREEVSRLASAAMPKALTDALARARAYVVAANAGNRSTAAPHDAVAKIAAGAESLAHPDAAAELLVEVAKAAELLDYDEWDGQDLRNVQPVVDAIGVLAKLPARSVPYLDGVLRANTHAERHATPGSPDAGKLDRNREGEIAQDALAKSAVAALARYREHAAPALEAVDAATKHRDGRVASLARDVAKAIRYYAS